jgi:cyclopropane-fatty-acyl-phospholipid synthase
LEHQDLQDRGASMDALAVHYELGDDFYALWLGGDMGYSSGLWTADTPDIDAAQDNKADYFASRLDVGPSSRVLDVGCAWGGPAHRLAAHHGATVHGLTRSPAHAGHVNGRGVPGLSAGLEGWADHEPTAPYDAIVVLEAMEHFAQDGLPAADRREIYSAFFDRCHGWLAPGGGLGLQVFCLENVGRDAARRDTPLVRLIRERVFPEAVPPYLADLVEAWDPVFSVEVLEDQTSDYPKTLRAWRRALVANADAAAAITGADVSAMVARYLAAGEMLFRLHEWSLYRAVLRPRPKRRVLG